MRPQLDIWFCLDFALQNSRVSGLCHQNLIVLWKYSTRSSHSGLPTTFQNRASTVLKRSDQNELWGMLETCEVETRSSGGLGSGPTIKVSGMTQLWSGHFFPARDRWADFLSLTQNFPKLVGHKAHATLFSRVSFFFADFKSAQLLDVQLLGRIGIGPAQPEHYYHCPPLVQVC